jgi:hypothetical protein
MSAARPIGVLRKGPTISQAEKFLPVLFILTIPLISARVREDGIGYYAYARSLIVDHNLQFQGDWKDRTQGRSR